jgi:hypothetical protein
MLDERASKRIQTIVLLLNGNQKHKYLAEKAESLVRGGTIRISQALVVSRNTITAESRRLRNLNGALEEKGFTISFRMGLCSCFFSPFYLTRLDLYVLLSWSCSG